MFQGAKVPPMVLSLVRGNESSSYRGDGPQRIRGGRHVVFLMSWCQESLVEGLGLGLKARSRPGTTVESILDLQSGLELPGDWGLNPSSCL